MSASLIISSTSSSVSFSPKLVITWRNSAALMNPFPSLSKTRNASLISSSESVSFILRAIIVRNSGKSMVPLPSASTSLIISWSSASVGFCPNDLITVPNSLVVMVPSPSLSNRLNASLNSVHQIIHIYMGQRWTNQKRFCRLTGNLFFSQLVSLLIDTNTF